MSLESLQKKYDKILNETKDITSPIIDRLTGNPSPSQASEVSEDGIIHRPCGVSKRVPKLDPVQIDAAQRKQEEITTEVDENPFEYPDAAQVRGDVQVGHGTGSSREKVSLPVMGKPKWFKELKKLVKGFGKPTRARGRDYYDIESLVRNVPEKESVRQKKKGDLVFTIVDTSGSMLTQADTGRTYMQEMAKYVPQIVMDYDGFVMVIDTEIKDIFPNKQVRKAMKAANANAMMLAGGGGTDFDKAYEEIVRRQRAEKFDSLIIVLTDGGVYLPANMIQELRSSIVVMPKEELDWFSSANPEFMTMVASPQYPAVKIVAIDFKTEE
jgi:putative intracellular protease/amidase